jgi:hypothetical protein
MQIEATHVLEFICEEAGEYLGQKFTTKGIGRLEGAPDWLRDHSYYALCEASGWIRDLSGENVPPVQDPDVAEYLANKAEFEAYMKAKAQPAGSHVTADPSELTQKPELDPDEPTGDAGTDEPGVDDGTLDVRSLAAKLNQGVGDTRKLLLTSYGVEAANGAHLLDKEVFDAVVANPANHKAAE